MDGLLEVIPDKLFREWVAFNRLEPEGYAIDNFRFGQICSTIANVQGNKTRPSDFFPRRKAPQTPQNMLDLLMAVFPKQEGD